MNLWRARPRCKGKLSMMVKLSWCLATDCLRLLVDLQQLNTVYKSQSFYNILESISAANIAFGLQSACASGSVAPPLAVYRPVVHVAIWGSAVKMWWPIDYRFKCNRGHDTIACVSVCTTCRCWKWVCKHKVRPFGISRGGGADPECFCCVS